MKSSIFPSIPEKFYLGAIILALLFSSRIAFAGNVPAEMNYQGQLVNAYGTNLPDGNYPLTFRIFDSPSGGNELWGDYNSASVAFVGGRFNVVLSTDNASRSLPTMLSGQAAAYLEIQVGNNSPITPRQQLMSAPYTLYAGNADTLGGISWGAVFTDTGSPTNGHIPGGKIAPNTITGAQLANGAVNTPQLASGAVTAANIAVGSVGVNQLATGAALANLQTGTVPASVLVPGSVGAASLDPNVLNALVPVGTVLPFFGNLTNLPPSWKLCDGSLVTDPYSPFNGQYVPNLQQQFLRGADPSNSYPVGATGGVDTIPDHSHYIYQTDSDVYIPEISGNGLTSSYVVTTGLSADGLSVNYNDSVQYVLAPNPANSPFDSHGHINGSATISGYTYAAGGHDNRPAFFSLYFILRIK